MRTFDAAAEHARIRARQAAPKPPSKRGSPERDFQRTAIQWLRLVLPPGSMVAASVNEQRGSGRTDEERMRYGAARKRSGVVSGWPDLTAVVANGPVVFIELKAPKGTLSASQIDVHARLRSAGHIVIVAKSLDDLRAGLRAAGVATRETV
jgi:hypothetical protein